MSTSSERTGTEAIATLADPPLQGHEQWVAPKGPTGLMRALADASTPGLVERRLPIVDAAAVGAGASLFDYDAALALDLDGEPLGR